MLGNPPSRARGEDFERDTPAEDEAYLEICRVRAVGCRSRNPRLVAGMGFSDMLWMVYWLHGDQENRRSYLPHLIRGKRRRGDTLPRGRSFLRGSKGLLRPGADSRLGGTRG